MIEVVGDLFTYTPGTGSVLRCVTTNGILKRDGTLVMGAGVAKQAALQHPELPAILGDKVSKYGNQVFVIKDLAIASFPTKHHWKESSDLNLIVHSAQQLQYEASDWDYIVMSRPGCGLGGLEWDDVKAVIEPYFRDDKFIVVSLSPGS